MNTNNSPGGSTLGWHPVDGGIGAPKGFRATGVMAGVKYHNKYDVALIFSEKPAYAAGVYTRNRVKAHPLLLTQKHLANGQAQAIVVNSGNANACVGPEGDEAAAAMAKSAAMELGLSPEDVVVASTGVIGSPLPVERVEAGIVAAARELRELAGKDNEQAEAAHRAALAIMTTDTTVKEVAYELPLAGGSVRLGGIAKGSGMIHPNMGTMLGFLTTDAAVPAQQLQDLLREAVDESFNMVTVDGDTSTNDMVVILANGCAGISPQGAGWQQFARMVKAACVELAQMIARDGEGASKFLEVTVQGAASLASARQIARSICGSSLVKAAMFGEDANWGRILAAAGYAGAEFDPTKVDIYLGHVQVAQAGQGLPFSEEEAKKVLAAKDIKVLLELHDGQAAATAWGCDLTHEYVTINGKYRT